MFANMMYFRSLHNKNKQENILNTYTYTHTNIQIFTYIHKNLITYLLSCQEVVQDIYLRNLGIDEVYEIKIYLYILNFIV